MKLFLADFSAFELVILFSTCAAFFVQAVYYLGVYGKVSWLKSSGKADLSKKEPVSVVICARNEEDNLTEFLPLVLEQEYPLYEVIVVNDCSFDNTQDILEKFQLKYPNLHVTRIKEDEKFSHGKKLALTIGIKAAKYERLLFTDADCKPESKQWLNSMQNNFSDTTDIVLGYGGYNTEKGFLNSLIRFDTFFIALQYLGFALCKAPYMGVGRNLAYKKALFVKNKGFASHAHLQSGDDDLFINEVANANNTGIEISLNSHTRSVSKKTFNSWVLQKKRHFSTGYRYKFKHKFLIGLENFTRLLFYAGVIGLLCSKMTFVWGIGLFLLRLIIQLSVFSGALKKLNEKKLLLISVLFDLILPLINIFLYTLNSFNSKQHKWK